MKHLLLILTAALSLSAQVKFVPVPKFPTSEANLLDFREIMGIPGNIPTFSTQTVIAGTLPAQGASAKPYRDNATIWQPGRPTFDYVLCCDGELKLSLRSRVGDAGTPVIDAEGITALEGLFSGPAISFYNDRFLRSNGREFSRIPRPYRVTLPRDEAMRLNLINPATPANIQWPVSSPLPVYTALRFNTSGVVEAFNINEYDKAFPLVSGALSDAELVGAVQAILASGMTVTEQAKAIRMVAK